uniref:Reverse transcriptase Ty1/copia-type domain-containing protein n=1 Tax=Solanum lycopersicum TaxID=4081 RepID=A0A3Q7IWP2_SOLLC
MLMIFKDLKRLKYFLGLEISYKDSGVLISQRKFTLDLLNEFECSSYSPVTSSLESRVKLKASEGLLLKEPTYYKKLVGKLNFLTNRRIDIAFSVQHLSQFLQNPREPHLKASYHVLRYLKNDPCLGIYLSNNANCSITAYCDSDWAVCPDTRKSVSGYVVLMGDNSISWKSKKQTTKSLSSAHAEYRAIRKVVGEIVWLERLLTELNLTCTLLIFVFCDSQAAIHIAKNPVFHERTKHIEVDCHFVRNKLQEGLIALHHIPIGNQLTDVLTKGLPNVQHSKILHKLFVIFPPTT